MTSKGTKKKPAGIKKDEACGNYFLMLHNDEVHSFEYVIEALVDICKHSIEQATQCTLITHHKGSCDIRKGNFKFLKKMKDALINRELSVTIELQS